MIIKAPDETVIRDADLLAEYEAKKGSGGFRDFVLPSLIGRQVARDRERAETEAKAKELAALPREKRRRTATREALQAAPPSPADLRHLHSVLAICGLPYDRQPIDVREYSREQGNMAIDVTAGTLRDGTGRKVPQPLPFGPKARLILMHLCSEAIRQKSPTVEIADSFTAFVREMGFSDSGGRKGPLTAFKEQLNALAACSIRMSAWNGDHMRSRQFFPIEQMDIWLSNNHDQASLWPSTVTFSPTMFESLSKHAIPLNARAVRAFAGSARKLDLYFWLGWRIHNIDAPLHLSWKAAADQFGVGFTRDRKFREVFAKEIEHLREVFPKLPLTVTENGLILTPADPKVLALPTPRPPRKKPA